MSLQDTSNTPSAQDAFKALSFQDASSYIYELDASQSQISCLRPINTRWPFPSLCWKKGGQSGTVMKPSTMCWVTSTTHVNSCRASILQSKWTNCIRADNLHLWMKSCRSCWVRQMSWMIKDFGFESQLIYKFMSVGSHCNAVCIACWRNKCNTWTLSCLGSWAVHLQVCTHIWTWHSGRIWFHVDFEFQSEPESFSDSESLLQLAMEFETESTLASENKIRLWTSLSISCYFGRICPIYCGNSTFCCGQCGQTWMSESKLSVEEKKSLSVHCPQHCWSHDRHANRWQVVLATKSKMHMGHDYEVEKENQERTRIRIRTWSWWWGCDCMCWSFFGQESETQDNL